MSKVKAAVLGGVLAAGVAVYIILRKEDPSPPSAAAASQPMKQHAENAQAPFPAPVPSPLAPDIVPPEQSPGKGVMPNSMPAWPDFAQLFKNPSGAKLAHDNFEMEDRDPVWATEMENAFNRAFSAITDLRSYQFPTVECRSTACEVRLLAHHAEPGMHPMDWAGILARGVSRNMVAVSPGEEAPALGAVSIGTNDIDGGAVVVMHIKFSRNKPRSQASQ